MYSAIYISSLQRGQPLHEITLHNRGCNFRVPAVRFFPPLFLICFLTLCFLLRLLALRSRILRHSIPIYLIPAHRISLSPAEVAAVAFNSVDVPAVAAFYNTYVIPAAEAVPALLLPGIWQVPPCRSPAGLYPEHSPCTQTF